jgi:hypothetical protein
LKKLLLAMLVPVLVSVSGCAALGGLATAQQPPAPLATTQIDDQSIKFFAQALDTVTESVIKLRDAGYLVKGTPTAIGVADALDSAADALEIVRSAQKGAQSISYTEALYNLRDAFVKLQVAIARVKGR